MEKKYYLTVQVENKFKKIYQKYEGYNSLSELDRNFFDAFFPILWVQEEVEFTNQELGKKFGYKISTIEKYIRRLRHAGLIEREVSRFYDKKEGRWTSKNKTRLEANFLMYMYNEIKLLPNVMKNIENQDKKEAPEETIEVVVPEEASTSNNDRFKNLKRR